MARVRENGGGSVYPVASRGIWRATITADDGRRVSRSAPTKREAERLLRQLLAEREQQRLVRGRLTVGDWLNQWLASEVAVKRKPRTLDAYESAVKHHLGPALGKIPLRKLAPADVRSLYGALSARRSASTVHVVHAVLSGALKSAEREGLVARNVASLVALPSIRAAEPKPLDLDQAARLLAACRGQRHGPLLAFILGSGCRFGEAAALRWSDLDGNRAVIRRSVSKHRASVDGRVRWVCSPSEPKTRRGRRAVALPPFVVEALAEQRASVAALRLRAGPRWRDLDLVFPTGVGTYLRDDHVLADFKALLVSLGLEPRRLHDLRHTYSTLLLDSAAADLATVQQQLGHAQIGTTADTYLGRLAASAERAAGRLGELLRPDS